jgi:hypothetical protein
LQGTKASSNAIKRLFQGRTLQDYETERDLGVVDIPAFVFFKRARLS